MITECVLNDTMAINKPFKKISTGIKQVFINRHRGIKDYIII